VYVWEFQNTVNERWYLINDRAIRWVDGRTVRMEIATDITERKQAEEQIRNSLKEKELLLQEVHHRVKNNMTVVHSLLELQSKHIHDERDGEMFRESMNRIKSMAMIHEKLYQAKDLANIDFSAYLKHMINNIFMSYGLTYDQVMLKVDVKDVTLGIDAAIPCGLIINELVSNSLKHAFPENMKGEVIVALIENDKNAFELTVRDNGIGIPDSIDVRAADTLGINLVTALVNQLQGTLEMKREQGTEFHIIFRRQ
jgi:two-component sensor histidine kinase